MYGRAYTRAELTARAGRFDALAGISPVERGGGRGRGVRELSVRTGSGFSFVSVVDRALDVALAYYDDTPLCWSSCNEIASPSFYEPAGDGFLFAGGLFTTCGIGNFGPPGSDAWGTFGLHGRIDATPAENVRYETIWLDDRTCVLEIAGTMRETRVFGENFRLERRLRAYAGGKRLELHDEVTNDAGTRRPHMILYHCNGGFPILGESAQLRVSHASVTPRDAEAERSFDVWDRGGAPERLQRWPRRGAAMESGAACRPRPRARDPLRSAATARALHLAHARAWNLRHGDGTGKLPDDRRPYRSGETGDASVSGGGGIANVRPRIRPPYQCGRIRRAPHRLRLLRMYEMRAHINFRNVRASGATVSPKRLRPR